MDNESKKQLWTGRVMSAVVVLFLLFDAIAKLLRVPAVVEGTAKVGYPDSSIQVLGVILLICTLLYAAPPTAVLGAVLLTGYLGGATATHLRIGDPVFSHVLFPVYMGAILWAGVLLRRPRLRGVLLLTE
jgi:hypothetical protein